MYCRKCGHQLEDDALFCIKCGTKIEVKKTTNENITEKINTNTEKAVEKISSSTDKFVEVISSSTEKGVEKISASTGKIVEKISASIEDIKANNGINEEKNKKTIKLIIGIIIALELIVILVALIKGIKSYIDRPKTNEEITLEELCEEYEQYVSENHEELVNANVLYHLIYLNDDNVPELIIDTKEESNYYEFISYNSGEFIVESLWEDTELRALGYRERGDVLYTSTVANGGYYYDRVYTLTETDLMNKDTGNYLIRNNKLIWCYWGNTELSVDEYLDCLDKYVGTNVTYLYNTTGSKTIEDAFIKIGLSRDSKPTESASNELSNITSGLLSSNENTLDTIPPTQMSSYDEVDTDEFGTALGYWKSEYDNAGNEIRLIYYDINGNLEWYRDKTYDNGLYTETNYTAEGLKQDFWEYRIKGSDRNDWLLLNLIYYDSEGNLESQCVKKYDENDNAISSTTYLSDGSVEWQEVYERYENGQVKSSIMYDGNGNIMVECAWDENGIEIKREYY